MILDWGYPPAFLPLIQALHEAGVVAWWFNGDQAAARESFTRRGTVSTDAFDRQMAAIASAWPELSVFYGSRIVTAIRSDGSFADPSELFAQIFGAEA